MIVEVVSWSLNLSLPAMSLFLGALFAVVVVLYYSVKAFRTVVWEPLSIKRSFRKQGVPCLPYCLLVGNMSDISRMLDTTLKSQMPLTPHNLGPHIIPHYYHWKNMLGDFFIYWVGYRAVLSINDPELIKEIFSNKFGHYRRIPETPEGRNLLGESVASLDGERWAHHRRVVSPAFFWEKLKGMTPVMVNCVTPVLDKWESEIGDNGNKEIDVHEEFKKLTADVIAHTAFGSSYEEGMTVFKLQQEQVALVNAFGRAINIPGARFIPTARNRHAWSLNRKLIETLKPVIMARENDDRVDDLLGILMAANRKELTGSQKNLSLSMQEIMDECKTFFFAGHETTATLLTWTAMLLAINPEWQEKARQEVLQVCGKEKPSYDALQSLKTIWMILHESLRLYPPAPVMARETTKALPLGNITVPGNTMIIVPIIDVHHNPSFWGPDALDFNPQRFADGVANASTTPLAFLPFSLGPRNCLGQNFAMLEAKIILAMILQRFRFSLSPGYRHAPATVITMQPQHGMQIIFEKMD